MKVILYVIIYGIMEYKYQKSGKMNNIKILKGMNIKIERKHLMMHILEKYPIKKIIMTLIYKIKIITLWHII